MGKGDQSGTLRKATLNGVTYRVPFDIAPTINYTAYENEGIATTGDSMIKKTLRLQTIENVIFITNAKQALRLQTLNDAIDNFTMSLELADGTVLRGNGTINFENWETEENRSTLTLIPDKSTGAWAPFEP